MSGRLGAWAAALCAVCALAGSAAAQAPHQVMQPPGEVPPLPSGDGRVQGRVVDESGAGVPELDVVLYALGPDGSPGLGGTRTDAGGHFAFDGVSSEPGVVYLLGTRHRDVPFGQRVGFAPGTREVEAELRVSQPSLDASAVLVLDTSLRLDWIGSQLFAQLDHRVRNAETKVVFVPEDAREGRKPAFAASLPDDTREFMDGQGSMGGGLVRTGDDLAFWGPLYPGDQQIRYGFLLDGPAPGADEPLTLALPFPSGTGQLRLIVPASGPPPTGDRVPESFESERIEDVDVRRYDLGGVAPGETVSITLGVPESSASTEHLRISRADYWVDQDDTAMRVTADYTLAVDSPVRLLAAPGEALLRVSLPEDAEFLGLSASARSMGVVADEAGGIEVRGPLDPGTSSLGFRYRLPTGSEGGTLDLRFERPVATLNVLVADNGVEIQTDRMHRRRPFRQGTRIYLHQEAYQVAAGETVTLHLRPLSRAAAPRAVTLAGGLVMAMLTAVFLLAPLRRGDRPAATGAAVSGLALEREALYDSIRDLEHDYETGKLEREAFERMRADLRADAVALLRRERAAAAPAPAAAEAPAETARPHAFCPGCGGRVTAGWRFCSHCGRPLTDEAGEPA